MDRKLIEDWQNKLRRHGTRIDLGKRPGRSLLESCFGEVRVALPGEIWPLYEGGVMWPLAQIDCTNLPHCPKALSDIAFLTLFISPHFYEAAPNPANGDAWCLRAYADSARLVELPQAESGTLIRPRSVHFEPIASDYPTHDDLPDDFPEELRDSYYESGLFPNADGSKVGGWPTNVQAEIFWAPHNRHPARPEYVFQIDSEPKGNWFWGDNGVGYFGRGTGSNRDIWTFDWQCY